MFIVLYQGYGDRVFYETLLKEIPSSEMAQDWCLAYGILEIEEATKLFKSVSKRKEKEKSGNTPVKASSSSSSSTTNAKKAKKSTIIDDIAADTGFEQSSAWESGTSIGV